MQHGTIQPELSRFLDYYGNVEGCVHYCYSLIRYGLVVRIAGSHPAGSGSIPGTGNYFKFILF